MKRQKLLTDYARLNEYLSALECKKIMLVHGRSMTRLAIGEYFNGLSERLKIIHFNEFTPNPDFTSVERGIEVFRAEGCDAIVAAGGGSAIDTAKCIKLFATMPEGYRIDQAIEANDIPLIAIPTTGGSGSEATQFAVIYYQGKKYSVEHDSALPDAVFFDATCLLNLPDYQKKVTLLDALCHSIESSWSIRANDESRQYAREAIRLIVANKDRYIEGAPDLQNCAYVLYAANLAGRAINISKTTAGHAMSYSLTKKFGLAHGHAVARCVAELWQFMFDYAVERKQTELLSIFDDIRSTMDCRTTPEAIENFRQMLNAWKLNAPIDVEPSIEELAASVNLQRLANNPIKLDNETLRRLYRAIGG